MSPTCRNLKNLQIRWGLSREIGRLICERIFTVLLGYIQDTVVAKNGVRLEISLPEPTPQRNANSVKLDLVAEGYSDFLYELGIIEIDSHEMIYMGTAK